MFHIVSVCRKSASLATGTRKRLVAVVCQSVCSLSSILSSAAKHGHTSTYQNSSQNDESNTNTTSNGYVVPQAFRDALACHLYMLYTIMIFLESEIKADKSLGTAKRGKGSKSSQDKDGLGAQYVQNSREACASAMLAASHAMAICKFNLWKRGVPDENIVSIPCRIAYQMLENSTGATARKLSSGDIALQIIATTLDSTDCLLNTVVSALVDMMHSFEHMAPLAAELCCLVKQDSSNLRGNKLAVELLREVGRLEGGAASASDTSGKASGIKNVAPFLNELAEKNPPLVLEHISLVLPHLHSEPYNLRSAIVVTIGHLLVSCSDDSREVDNEGENEIIGVDESKSKKLSETKQKLYDILLEHVYDVSSFTRVAVMKTWASLIQAQSLPIDKLIPVTELAIDRLQDKTVMVRRSAMQVCVKWPLRVFIEDVGFF